MNRRTLLPALVLLLIAGLAILSTGEERPDGVDIARVTVCPAAPASSVPPDFAAPACQTMPTRKADPQGREIWVQAVVRPPDALVRTPRPLGLHISASASTAAWLNGAYIGRNGAPGPGAAREIPGRLDGIIPVPSNALRAGENVLTLRMSNYHGRLRLTGPIQSLRLGDYARPADVVLRRYGPPLMTLGVLLLGAFYFGAMAARGDDRRGSLSLTLMSLFAAAQLLAETARGLVPYAYPLHDLRLVLITAFSFGFGLCLAALVAARFLPRPATGALAGLAVITLASIAAAPGFDQKAILAVLVPTLACALATAVWTWRRRPQAGLYLAALAAFAGLMLSAPAQFLNARFFYVAAVLLLFLVLERAGVLRPPAAPDEAAQTPVAGQIRVKAAGRIDLISIDRISHCNGAGDYVELCFRDGGQTLHHASLNALAESLPQTFLRVHRSHIVNMACVRSLTRQASGIGQLQLTNGSVVPVSRRALPALRGVLGSEVPATPPGRPASS